MAVSLARRNLLHEKGKMILSAVGIAASLTLILLLSGFREGLYATLTAYVDNLGADLLVAQSGVKGMFSSDSTLPLEFHEKIINASGAIEAGHILVADVIFTADSLKTPILFVGYDPKTSFGSPWQMDKGRLLERESDIVLDTWLAKRSGITLGDTVALLGKKFQVVGLSRGTSSWMSPYVFVTLEAGMESLGYQGMVSYHLLRLPEGLDVNRTARLIEAQIPGVDILTPLEIAQADSRIMATVMDTPLNVMSFIGIIIGIAVMGLTAYSAVIDHVREYGVLKAVGASNLWLARLIVGETIYRAVLGYVLGIGLAFLTAGAIMSAWPQFNIVFGLDKILQTGGLVLVMTVVAATLPLHRLKKIDPMIVFKA